MCYEALGTFWSSEPRCRLKAGDVRPNFTTYEVLQLLNKLPVDGQ